MKTFTKLFCIVGLCLNLSGCFSCKNLVYSPVLGIDASKFAEDGDYGDSGSQSLIGIQAGVDINAPINEQLSFESGLKLAGKGTKSGSGSEEYSYNTKTNMTYIDVPLLTRYSFGQGFSAYGGVQPSVLVSAKQKTDGIEGGSSGQNVKDNFKGTDLAGSIGVGYQFKNGIRLNLGYDHGFSNIAKSESFGAGKINSRTFKFTVGYQLGGKK